eukprot:COSAG02_NODE_50803_length_318_cov_0.712329_1_plen_58_part_01
MVYEYQWAKLWSETRAPESWGRKGALNKVTKPQAKALLEKTSPRGAQSSEGKPELGIV